MSVLEKSLAHSPRAVWIVYHNPLLELRWQRRLFWKADQRRTIRYTEIPYSEPRW